MKEKHYARLSIEDREIIRGGLTANLSYAETGRKIGRSTSNVLREVKKYYGRYANGCCSAQRKTPGLIGRMDLNCTSF